MDGMRRTGPAIVTAVFAAGAAPALAGAVTVTDAGKVIRITGDAETADEIVIRAGDPGQIVIASNGIDTTVNGGQETVLAVGGGDRILVQLGDGTNQVRIEGELPEHKSLTILGGTGYDTLTVESAVLPGDFAFKGGEGGSVNNLGLSTFKKLFLIAGGAGLDSLYSSDCRFEDKAEIDVGDNSGPFQGVALFSTTALEKFRLRGGEQDDTFSVSGGTFDKSLLVDSGGGNDSVTVSATHVERGVTAKLGEGNDALRVESGASVGGVKAAAGPGNDALLLSGPQVNGNVKFIGDDGDDAVNVFGLQVTKSVQLFLGDGNDSVDINASLGLAAQGDLVIDGGKGDDLVNGLGSATAKSIQEKRVEEHP